MGRQTTSDGQNPPEHHFTGLAGSITTGHQAGTDLSVRFDRGPTAAAAARNALAALERRLDPRVVDDIRLLVSELVTNAVRHADAPRGGVVCLDVSVTGPSVRVEVADPGPGFDPRPRKGEMIKPGGWGLYLVDRIADRWGVVRNAMTRVWFELDTA